jgi:hypothetical protein
VLLYAYNGDTNIFTFIGVGIAIFGLVRLPKNECYVCVSIHLTKSLVSLLIWQMVTVKNMPIWLVISTQS